MKSIFFDLDTDALLSKDGRARPFMDIILRYCAYSKIECYIMVSAEKAERSAKFYEAYNADNNKYAALMCFTRGKVIPCQPNLVISCDGEYLRKWPGLLVQPYVPERSNEFMELAFAGSLLEMIKNRVVLSRGVEPVKVEKSPETSSKNKEDFSNWAFEV